MIQRFYRESDGPGGARTHYVIDRYADPASDHRRIDVDSRLAATKLAAACNRSPPWPVWDVIQADRDGYAPSINKPKGPGDLR